MSFDGKESSRYGGAPFELYRFTMGSEAWYLTSGDVARVHDTFTYAPETIDRSDLAQNGETDAGNIDVEIPLTSALAEQFLTFVPPYPMFLTIFAGHDGDPDVIVRFQGRVAQATFERTCKLRVVSMLNAIRKKVPAAVYQTRCNRSLYAPGCDVLQSAHTVSAQVAALANGGRTVTLAGAALEAAWQSAYATHVASGLPTLEMGILLAESGHRMMIAQHTAWNTIALKAPLYGLQVGQAVEVSKGCFGTAKHCGHFNNRSRFLGFDSMPTKNIFATGIVRT